MSPRTPRSTLTLMAGALASLIALLGACGSEGNLPATAAADPAASDAPPADGQLVDLAALGFDEGDPETALYGVVEFADFGCIHCAEFHALSFPALHDEFVASGEAVWKYVPITIGGFPNGRLAGLSGVCGGMLGQFAPMRDQLYLTREAWSATTWGTQDFVGLAGSVGLDTAAFATCLAGEEAARELDANDQMARMIGVTGTPTFIVGGTPVRGAPPLAAFQEALRQLAVQLRAQTDSVN